MKPTQHRAAPLKLTLDGKPVSADRLPPTTRQVIDFVVNLPDGKLVTAKALAIELKLGRGTCSRAANKHVPDTHYLMDGSLKIYGNPKTLAAYRQTRGIDT